MHAMCPFFHDSRRNPPRVARAARAYSLGERDRSARRKLAGWNTVDARKELVDQRAPRSRIFRRAALERSARELALTKHFRLFLPITNRELGGVLVHDGAVVRLKRVVRAAANHRHIRCVWSEALPLGAALLDDRVEVLLQRLG